MKAADDAPGVITTQATAKNHKQQQLLGAGVLCAGVVMAIIGAQGSDSSYALWGAGLVLVGLIWYLVARVRAWWGHG